MKLVAAILLGIGLLCARLEVAAQELEFEGDLEQQLIRLINEERAKRGLERLAPNEQLRQSAQKHTERLAESGILSHQFTGEPQLANRIASTGLNFYASAENVGLATEWPDVHPGFMRSEGHRANILSPKYNAVGVGVLKRGDYYYVTENFARVGEGLTAAQAEQRVTRLLAQKRGQVPFAVAPSQLLRNAACEMARRDEVEATAVPFISGGHGAVAFTASDLDGLPEGLNKLVNDPDVRRIGIGACFKATKTYPGGTYWFAVQY
jgi:hypothetical protein